ESRQMGIAADAGLEVRERRGRAAAGGGGAGVGGEEDSRFLSRETRGIGGAHGSAVGEEARRSPKQRARRANVIAPSVPLSSRYVLRRTAIHRVLLGSQTRVSRAPPQPDLGPTRVEARCRPSASSASTTILEPCGVMSAAVSNPVRSTSVFSLRWSSSSPLRTRQEATSVAPFQLMWMRVTPAWGSDSVAVGGAVG